MRETKQGKERQDILIEYKKLESLHTAVGIIYKIGVAAVKNDTAVSQKIKHKLAQDTAFLLLDSYPKEFKTETSKDIFTAMFTAALFTTD